MSTSAGSPIASPGPDSTRQDDNTGVLPDPELGRVFRLSGRVGHDPADLDSERSRAAGEQNPVVYRRPLLGLYAPALHSIFEIADDGECQRCQAHRDPVE